MTRRRHGARWLVAALTALITAGFAGASGLVLCLGSDGHRALELQHPGMVCTAVAGDAADARAISAVPIGAALATCFDLPAVGGADAALPSAELVRVPTPPLAIRAPIPALAAREATYTPAPVPARAAPPPLARHLRSTHLLV